MKQRSYSSNGLSYRLMIVDDDPLVLSSISRCLVNEGFEIDFLDDAPAAFEQTRQVKYDLILSDYKMPELDGLMLMAQVGRIQPQAKRLIMAAVADKVALLEAVNQAAIDRFIVKPWEPDNLRFEIRRALGIEAMPLDNEVAL